MRLHRFILRAAACCALTIPLRSPADEVTRIVLAGDSTVAPGSGWGDGLIQRMNPGVAGINLGMKGRSSKSYRAEGWWQKVLDTKPTWVLIQFGHNAQPGKGPKLETNAKTTFRENLIRYIDEAEAIGAKPVIVTSLVRRNFDSQGKIMQDPLEPYVEAARMAAAEKSVPLIDLYARSIEHMNQLGPESAAAYDAKLVADEIRKATPELSQNLHP